MPGYLLCVKNKIKQQINFILGREPWAKIRSLVLNLSYWPTEKPQKHTLSLETSVFSSEKWGDWRHQSSGSQSVAQRPQQFLSLLLEICEAKMTFVNGIWLFHSWSLEGTVEFSRRFMTCDTALD